MDSFVFSGVGGGLPGMVGDIKIESDAGRSITQVPVNKLIRKTYLVLKELKGESHEIFHLCFFFIKVLFLRHYSERELKNHKEIF